MKMQPQEIIKTCSTHYDNWKDEALRSRAPEEIKKFLNKAFFWLELQNSLLILWTIENTMKDDPEVEKKLRTAEENVNKKIADYASTIVKDLEQK